MRNGEGGLRSRASGNRWNANAATEYGDFVWSLMEFDESAQQCQFCVKKLLNILKTLQSFGHDLVSLIQVKSCVPLLQEELHSEERQKCIFHFSFSPPVDSAFAVVSRVILRREERERLTRNSKVHHM